LRESGSCGPYPHRLVPFGFEHSARLCGASMVAELAHATGRDPKDMLLELIGEPRIVKLNDSVKEFWNYGEPLDSYPIDAGRLRGVVELVADKANGPQGAEGTRARIAAHRSFVSYVATIVEVSVSDKGDLRVERVDTAIDCGTFVNPSGSSRRSRVRRSWAQPRQARRDQLQERQGGAGQFRRFPCGAYG